MDKQFENKEHLCSELYVPAFLEFEVLKSAGVVENTLVTQFDSSERYK